MATPAYVFKRTAKFRKLFDALSPGDQTAAKEVFKKFRIDPFDHALKTHKINRLSSIMKKTVRAVVIKGDLRAVFTINGNVVSSFGIGTHDIYK